MLNQSQLKLIIATIFGLGALFGAAGFIIYDSYQKKKRSQMATTQNELPNTFSHTSPLKTYNRSRTNSSTTLFYSDNESLYTQAESEFEDEEEFYSLSEGEEDNQETNVPDDIKKVLRRIDSLIQRPGKLQNCIKELEECQKQFGDNCEIFWRLSKCYYNLFSQETENEDLKKEFNQKATEYGEQAVSLDENNYNAHKWFAISIGASTEYLSTKDKILNGFRFQKHLEIAISMNPDDYSLYHLLGRFKYEVSGLTWLERSLASTLFANPPSATYLEALEAFKKAESLNKNNPWKENKFYIAKCHYAIGDRILSKEILQDALDIPATNDNDILINEEIAKQLETLKF